MNDPIATAVFKSNDIKTDGISQETDRWPSARTTWERLVIYDDIQ